MDNFRYILALALICTFPPMLLYWPLIHVFIRFWRRLGPTLTYVIVLGAVALIGFLLFRLRAGLLTVEFGTSWFLVAVGVLCLAAAAWLQALLRRDVTYKQIAGLPELEPKRYPQQLVRTGLYARVRHPRYLQISLALLGYVLIANYLSGYVIWLVWLPTMYGVALLEERELRERFGEDYERYRLGVARFLPKMRGRDKVDSATRRRLSARR